MNKFIVIGKLATALMWLVMIYNLFMPFAGKVSIALNFFMLFTVMMHLFQVLIFHTMFSEALKLKGKDYLQPFFFGVFALLQYRQRLLSQ
ncbi:DUF1145 domain-containing protein [Shewanella sp. WXL01]|uniref:DUF1145 domain-containing protein n=1 Tax=Shewanella maritima TaxID=2520507 RepID=A0A411PGL6_9GAMM|nr:MULTISPECIES: DUF1145 domain-containing protein [Shewanella]NKF49141.1 DUF1145 domain-containing protein [Shewanella sp. WXL01]QBF82736.1 DUF1145 domain-containing protein [Shewanella maritima]